MIPNNSKFSPEEGSAVMIVPPSLPLSRPWPLLISKFPFPFSHSLFELLVLASCLPAQDRVSKVVFQASDLCQGISQMPFESS